MSQIQPLTGSSSGGDDDPVATLDRPPEGASAEDKRVRSISEIDGYLSRGERNGYAAAKLPGAGSVFRALPRRTRQRFTGDVLAMALVSTLFVYWLGAGWREGLLLLGFDAIYVLSLHVWGLYSFGELREGPSVYLLRFAGAFVAGFLIVLPIALIPALGQEAGFHGLATLVVLVLWRLVIERRLTLPPVRVVVAGAGKAASSFLQEVAKHPEFEVIGVFDDDHRNSGVGGYPVLGTSKRIPKFAVEERAQLMVVAITHDKRPQMVDAILACQYAGIPVLDMPSAFELMTGRLPLEHCSHQWLAFSGNIFENHSGMTQRVKRTIDAVLGAVGLAVSAPLILLSALAIRLDSRGPVFYRQVRVGRFGRPFMIIKLRTMTTDAEAASGAVWSAGREDPRVTRVGRVLRALRLDELPQFWNVLIGDMSITGPRPERPEFVYELSDVVPFYSLRHGVRPGITGWAQVSYPYGASAADALRKLEYDLFYVRHYTLLFDVRIMLKTLRVMILRTGSA